MAWKFDNERPIHIQITDKIKTDILCGRYKMQEKMPSVRELALSASVNPNTMQKAFAVLEGEGLIITQGTSGRFVTNDEALLETSKTAMLKGMADDFVKKCNVFGLTRKEAAKMLLEEE